MKFSITNIALLGAMLLPLAAFGQDEVSFKKQVRPIIRQNCQGCHSHGKKGFESSGLDLTSYSGLMKGTRFGPVVKPGDSMTSALIMLIEGRADPSIKMPHGAKGFLPKDEIETLKSWVDQGAKKN